MDEIVVLIVLILAVFFSFPIYVLVRLAHLRHDVNMLIRRSDLGVPTTAAAGPLPPALSLPDRAAAKPVATVPFAEQPRPTPPIPRPVTPPPVLSAAPTKKVKIEPAQTAARQSPFAKLDVESLLGANWLAKLGVAAIAVSAAFFLQFAFRSGWIGPKGQVAIGLGTAAVMLTGGQYLLTRERYRNYAQVLASGGIVVFFLSIYAAYSFYHPRIMGFGPAFAALAAGALAASVLALANNTQAVALLCILGAFATPVMIREGGATSTDSLVRLYAYLAVLNVWVAALTRLRPWHSLSVVAFTGTWIMFFAAGTLKNTGWQTEGFAGLFLLSSCYFGSRALYAQKAEKDAAPETMLRDTMKAGLGLIVGGCIAFAIASGVILSGMGLLGLSDISLAGLLLALLLAGLAVALPQLGHYDRPIRLLFGYLAATALAGMMVMAVETSASVPAEHVPIALGFAAFNYVLFLATALIMHRRTEEEGPAAALAGTNTVIHVLIAFHILKATQIWHIPAAPLWLPMAGLATWAGLWIANRQRPTARLLPGTLMVSAHVLALCGLFVALPEAGSVAGRWPAWSVALVGAEFAVLSAAWLALRRQIAWPAFRFDILAAFANAAVFFGLMARAVGTDRYQGISLLAGCAVALAVYHALVGAVALRRDDQLHRLIYLGIGLTFVTIAIPLQLRASYITVAWAAEAAVLVWTGMTAKQRRVRVYGVALFVLAACRALAFDLADRPDKALLFFNVRMMAGGSIVVAAYLSAWWLWKGRGALAADERRLPWDLAFTANLFTLLFMSVDLWDYFGRALPAAAQPGMRQFALTALWSIYALAAVCIAAAYRFRPLRILGVALLGFAVVKGLTLDITTRPEHVRLLLNTRMMAGLTLIAAVYLSAWLISRYSRSLSTEERLVPAALGIAANALTLAFVSVDLWDYAGMRWPSGATASAPQLALSLFWTGYALVGISVGIWKRIKPVRLFAMGLLYISIGKVFLFDLRNLETPYRIVSFFTLGVILLLVSLLYTRFEERLRAEEAPQPQPLEPPHREDQAA